MEYYPFNKQKYTRSQDKSDKCKPSYFFQIPYKIDTLHTHGSNASSGTNDEHTSTSSSGIGDKMPQHRIGRMVIHSHRGGHEGYIIYNRRQHPQKQHHHILIGDGHL